MTGLISLLYPAALDCEISPERFWELSLLEITDLMEGYERRKQAAAKRRLAEYHFLAQDIGQFVALVVFGRDQVQIMELWDFFPDLFQREKAESEQRQKEKQLALYKAQMTDFMYRHNRKTGGGG